MLTLHFTPLHISSRLSRLSIHPVLRCSRGEGRWTVESVHAHRDGRGEIRSGTNQSRGKHLHSILSRLNTLHRMTSYHATSEHFSSQLNLCHIMISHTVLKWRTHPQPSQQLYSTLLHSSTTHLVSLAKHVHVIPSFLFCHLCDNAHTIFGEFRSLFPNLFLFCSFTSSLTPSVRCSTPPYSTLLHYILP